jgi:hypothetical protein
MIERKHFMDRNNWPASGAGNGVQGSGTTTRSTAGEQTGMSDVVSNAKETIQETAGQTVDTAKQAAQEIAEQTQEQVEDVVAQAVSQTSEAIGDIKEQATSAYMTQRDRAVEMLGALAGALKETGQQLSRESGAGVRQDGEGMSLAPYFDEAADRISQSADFLRDKDMSGLLHEAQTLAKKQPLLFLGAMFGVGVAGARLLKGMNDGDMAGTQTGERQAASTDRAMRPDGGDRSGQAMNESLASAPMAGSAASYGATGEWERPDSSGVAGSARTPEQQP